MTGFVEDLSFDETLNEFREVLSKFQPDEEFLGLVFLVVKTTEYPHKIKMCCLNLVVEKYENEIELLHSQIQSYDFLNPKEFLQNLPSPSHEEIVLPSDLQIEDNHAFKRKTEKLVAGFSTEDTTIQLDQESPKETITHYAFVDPIADYMEVFLNSKSLTCFLYEDQIHQKWPFYVIISIM